MYVNVNSFDLFTVVLVLLSGCEGNRGPGGKYSLTAASTPYGHVHD